MISSELDAVYTILQKSNGQIDWQPLLEKIIHTFDCSTGTVHTLDKSDNLLKIRAMQGIPESLLPKMSVIPIGKGMAGIAAERKQAVEICNLQTDDSGVARPSAKDTKVEGSIAVPMLLQNELYGVFGIAKPVPYDFTEEEIEELLKIGEEMSKQISKPHNQIS